MVSQAKQKTLRQALTIGLLATPMMTVLCPAAFGGSGPGVDVCVSVASYPSGVPFYVRGPRIIRVPRHYDAAERRSGAPAYNGASIIHRDQANLSDDGYFQHRTTRLPRRHPLARRPLAEHKRSAAREPAFAPLPLPAPRRKADSDGPPPLSAGPTPIRPTPNFGDKNEPPGKTSRATPAGPDAGALPASPLTSVAPVSPAPGGAAPEPTAPAAPNVAVPKTVNEPPTDI